MKTKLHTMKRFTLNITSEEQGTKTFLITGEEYVNLEVASIVWKYTKQYIENVSSITLTTTDFIIIIK